MKVLWLIALLLIGCAAEPTYFNDKVPLYNKITLDIVSVKGYEPEPESLNYFEKKLKQYHLCKELIVKQRSINLQFYQERWNLAAIQMFEAANKTIKKSEKSNELNIFIAFLPGGFARKKLEDLAGLQYIGGSIVIFKDYVFQCEDLILLHEFGHLLLIADDQNNPNRKPVNPNRPNHCNNPKCIMFWKVNTQIEDFDEDCRREILNLLNKN